MHTQTPVHFSVNSQAILNEIEPVSDQLVNAARRKIDNKTKPLGALGRLEAIAVQACLIQNTLEPKADGKSLFVFAGDHGVAAEGVSAFPAEVTPQMVLNFLSGGAAINVLCRHHDIDIRVVDMGVNADFEDHPMLIKRKVRKATRNFAMEPAMTMDEAIRAIENGMAVFIAAKAERTIDIVGMGEMGIGNTTSASAIIAAVTGIAPEDAVGRGTGIDDKGLARKADVIRRALALHQPEPGDGIDILRKVGGFEIAGIAGAVLAAASRKSMIVLDGLISTAGGLLACLIEPEIKGYLFAGHRSVEAAQKAALQYMGIEPILDLRMRLGEGTGAAMAMDIVDAACRIMREMASFDDAGVSRES